MHLARLARHGDPDATQRPARATWAGACDVEGCENPRHNSRGWCRAHYLRWHKHGDVSIDKRATGRALCSIEGCARASAGRGWCKLHHRRWSKYGDPHYVTMTKAESVRVALAARLAKPAQTRGKRWVHLKHRPALVAAWNGLCGLCDEPMVDHLSVPGVPRALWLTIDHIDPGGSDDIDNLRIVHASCNSARGNRAAITRVPPPWVRNPAHRSTAWVKVSR